MATHITTAEWLNLRAGHSTLDSIIGQIPRGTIVDEVGRSPQRRWVRVRVGLNGRLVDGWVYSRYLSRHVRAENQSIYEGLFSIQARRSYVNSIVNDVDRMNFLRPSRQAWANGVWLHGLQNDGQFSTVGASWASSQNDGILEIVSPISMVLEPNYWQLFDRSMVSTYCNFNVSYCFQQAYGGSNLQDPNGTAAGGERSANHMINLFRSDSDWVQLGPADAAAIANRGGFVIVGWWNRRGSGHVVFLLEGCEEPFATTNLQCFHVGRGKPRPCSVRSAFGNKTALEFFAPRKTYNAWFGV